ncbi:enhancer of split mdelta protein [Drosophila eugracilis]|uniref:enhancer of split mdelta protein n=1 Tax=Drosophila eugracilis TaxID=29029 RepID=UPI0007E84238|nr:enhancer of split mdelta protein [Drosophila eugracilis]
MSGFEEEKSRAISRSHQYCKVTKPLLERKRRARINHCVDDLKSLLKEVIQMDVDSLAKLEKADVLELTVHHLNSLHTLPTTTPIIPSTSHQFKMQPYWWGFRQCALEVTHFLQRNDCQLNFRFVEEFEQQLEPPTKPILWRPWMGV